MGRALRRHHRDRLKKKRKYYHGATEEWFALFSDRELAGRLSSTARTPTPCSCWMCGNQRRICGPTFQERKFTCCTGRTGGRKKDLE